MVHILELKKVKSKNRNGNDINTFIKNTFMVSSDFVNPRLAYI